MIFSRDVSTHVVISSTLFFYTNPGFHLVSFPISEKASFDVSCSTDCLVINSFHFCTFFFFNLHLALIFERYSPRTQNSRFIKFFFHYFKDVALLSCSLHCLLLEICFHSYICFLSHNNNEYSFLLYLLLRFSSHNFIKQFDDDMPHSFLVLGACWASWNCWFIVFIKFGSILVIVSYIFLTLPFL